MQNFINNFFVKLFVVIAALALPWVLLSVEGPLPSISTYWMSKMQPAFIFVNAAISYHLFNTRRWEIPSLFLLILTAFSIEMYPVIHNVSSVAFFATSAIPFFYAKRLQFYLKLYACSILFLFHSILAAEIIGISILCLYHAHVLIVYNCIKKKREKQNQNNL
jgi:hypothetical protein